MDRVMGFCQLLADMHEFGGYQAQAAPLQPGDHFPDQSALPGTIIEDLNEDECMFQISAPGVSRSHLKNGFLGSVKAVRRHTLPKPLVFKIASRESEKDIIARRISVQLYLTD